MTSELLILLDCLSVNTILVMLDELEGAFLFSGEHLRGEIESYLGDRTGKTVTQLREGRTMEMRLRIWQ